MPSRRWTLRVCALLLGLLPLVACETAFRLSGLGRASEVEDPYVGFSDLGPLFQLNRASGRYEIPVSRQALFREESFVAEKGEGEFRIFCLGGSTVQGRPYAIETSFTTWLELSLQAADPGREWQVVNCGGVSYASYRLVPVVRELLAYEPDLFIIYTGHNEFLEDRTYAPVKRTPWLVAAAHAQMSRLRTYTVLRSAWLRVSGRLERRPRLAADAEPLLDFRGGLEEYHRDDVWRDGVIQHFRHSLGQIVTVAQDAETAVLLCNPVSNLKDTPPFKSQLSDGLKAAQVERFQELFSAGVATELSLDHRMARLSGALAIDPRHAGLHYELGRCYLELGLAEQAKTALIRAKDEDICPLRILEPMHTVIGQVAAERQVPLIDVCRSFESRSPHGIPGDGWMVDHVHPTIEGHQLIAAQIVERLARLGIVKRASNWQSARDEAYRRHLASLSPDYFAEAELRLQGLRRWTSGRAFEAPK